MCSYCGATFADERNLWKHERTRHLEDTKPRAKRRLNTNRKPMPGGSVCTKDRAGKEKPYEVLQTNTMN